MRFAGSGLSGLAAAVGTLGLAPPIEIKARTSPRDMEVCVVADADGFFRRSNRHRRREARLQQYRETERAKIAKAKESAS